MPTITPKRLVIAGVGCLVVYLAAAIFQSWVFRSWDTPISGSLAGIQVTYAVVGLFRPLGVALVVGGLVLRGIRTLLAEDSGSPDDDAADADEAGGLESADVLDSDAR